MSGAKLARAKRRAAPGQVVAGNDRELVLLSASDSGAASRGMSDDAVTGRRGQRTAIAVAFVGCLVLLVVVTAAAHLADAEIGVYQDVWLARRAAQAQDRVAFNVRGASVGCGACLALLLWAWLLAPQAGRPDTAVPPIGVFVMGAGLALIGWVMAFGIDLENGIRPVWWDVLFAVVGGAGIAWTAWTVTGWDFSFEIEL
jgi:hypothetical protein